MPQQNRLAERTNSTVLNTDRAIIRSMKVPKTFWPYVFSTAIEVRNFSPTSVILKNKPPNLRYDTKPRIDYLCVFGCQSEVYVQKSQRTELDAGSRACISSSYTGTHRNYWFCNLETRKSVVSGKANFTSSIKFQKHQQNFRKQVYSTHCGLKRLLRWILSIIWTAILIMNSKIKIRQMKTT